MTAMMYAVLAAVSFGLWTVFHKLASPHINQLFGAIVISFTAVIAGILILIPQVKNVQLVTNSKGIYFVIFAGLMAFSLDYFVLQAYSKGLPITIGGPIIIGGSIAVAACIGFLLGDSITIPKITGLVFILIGAIILSMSTQ